MDADSPTTEASTPGLSRPYLVGLLVTALVAGLIGYAVGSRHEVTEQLHGTAYVGNHMASIKSGDRYYGVNESVPWFDGSGTFNEEGWPSCLGEAGNEVEVTFGVAPVSPPEAGLSFGAVVYIDCRSRAAPLGT